MVCPSAFCAEPWRLREDTLDLALIAQTESVFALSNGHIGWRANLDEGEPHGLTGSYLGGFYETRPLPYAEAEYGAPESAETVIDVTNGKVIRLLVDDEPFDVRYGQLLRHERELDFRAGVLTREVDWVSPDGQRVRVRSQRLVSFTQRAIAAICYEVEAVQNRSRVVVSSELVANEPVPPPAGDPRAAAMLQAPLVAEQHEATGTRVTLLHRTKASRLRTGAAMDHVLEEPSAVVDIDSESSDDLGRTTFTALLQPGQRLRLVKFVAYGWSSVRSMPAIRAQVHAALAAARQTGWDGLVAEQRGFLDQFWDRVDVELDGDCEVQQAVRFGLFHVAQAGGRTEGRAIPAKGLTGPGYSGHSFWDTEGFVLPVLTYTMPEAAAHALGWRQRILPSARNRAKQLGLAGAAFPWRTISGPECSGYWPAGAAAFHVNADIAAAVVRYLDATGDEEFERDVGVELLTDTARLWRSLGYMDDAGRFRIDGVTGPDEYSAVADNNVYTNLMAQRNLLAAAKVAQRCPEQARELGVSADEVASWRDAAAAMVIPYDEKLGVHPQAEGFTDHEIWDFDGTGADQYPLMLHFPYFDLYRKQVVKQADLVLAMCFVPEAFTDEQKAKNFEYYEALTVRDSSLSAAVQAVLAAEVGHLSLAMDYLGEAALMDLADLEHNTRDGVHIASLAGSWIALVAGLGGMRHCPGEPLRFAPRLPPPLTRLRFRLYFRGCQLCVEAFADSVRYGLTDGQELQLNHYGEVFTLHPDETVTKAIPPCPRRERPRQPRGREPVRRHVT